MRLFHIDDLAVVDEPCDDCGGFEDVRAVAQGDYFCTKCMTKWEHPPEGLAPPTTEDEG